MSNQAIYHFGSPFIDTIIKEQNLNSKDTVQKVKFEERLGGVCNSIDYAFKLKIDTHLVISEKDELLIKSLLNRNKYIKFHLNKDHKHLRAFIFDDLKTNKRKSYVSLVKQTPSTISIKKINIGKIIISYIEDFPVRIESLIEDQVNVFADFNNSMTYSYQTPSFKKLLKENFKRVNYLLFSEDDYSNLESFINLLNFGNKDKTELGAIVLISHDPQYVKFYKIKYLNSSFKLSELSVVKNNYHLESIKSSIGNGDLFSILFTYYFIDKSSLKKTVNLIMKEISTIIAMPKN